MTELLEVAPREIAPHPHNPRRSVGDVDELAASIKELGVLEPLIVAPQVNGGKGSYQLIAGARRLAAAKQARAKLIPVIVRSDLDTSDRQVVAALVENLNREDLSPMEEAESYQLLLTLSYTQARIAKSTGRSPGVIRDRLKLTKLPAKTRDRIHKGQVTLTDALALTEFADDDKALKVLEAHIGGSSFAWYVQQQRDRRRDAKAAVKLRTELETAGVRIVPDPGVKYNGDDGPRRLNEYGGPRVDPEEHAKTCEHHAVAEPTSGVPRYVCLEPTVHDDIDNTGQKLSAKERAAIKAEREAEDKFKADAQTALGLRWTFIRETSTNESRRPQLRALATYMTVALTESIVEPSPELWARFLGAPDEVSSDYEAADRYVRRASIVPERMFFLGIAADAEGELQNVWAWRRLSVPQLAWLDLLASAGYQPSDFEVEAIKTAQDALAAEEAKPADEPEGETTS